MSNLFYRGGVRAGSNLSILKEAKKNYMGQFIFSRGVGVYLLIPMPKKIQKTFCGFSMGRNQYWAGRVYDLRVYYMTGTPKGSTESGFMEKPGFEPATPGLQGIALIHYTTGASIPWWLHLILWNYYIV